MKNQTKKKSRVNTQMVTVVKFCRNIGRIGVLRAGKQISLEDRVKKISKLYEESDEEMKKLVGAILAGDIRVERRTLNKSGSGK